jgi:hypothetical protein
MSHHDEDKQASAGATPGFYVERIRPPAHTEAENAQRLMTGAAWDEFCERLKRAGKHILDGGFTMEPIDYADGFHYLAGLAGTGLQQALTFATPDLPRFFRNPDTRSKWGGENPDNLYLWTKIRPDRTYKVTGTLSNCREILFELHDGYMQLGDVKVSKPLPASQLVLNPDRSFEIIISPQKHDGNWLELLPEYHYLLVRQYLYDWATERPTDLHIVQVGGEGLAPPALTPGRMAELLDEAGLWTEVTAEHWRHWMWEALKVFRKGELPGPSSYVGGIQGLHYGQGYFVVEPDEAQIIECTVPDARYWHFMLHNNCFVSLDYISHQSCLNGKQMHVDADGKARLVIAHPDPGVPNWLDPCGHRTGMIQYRWLWVKDSPVITTKVVPFKDLRQHLPPGTPTVSAAERRQAIAVRQHHMTKWREPYC